MKEPKNSLIGLAILAAWKYTGGDNPYGYRGLGELFVFVFFVLGYLGVQPPSPTGERISQLGTLFYFGFFLLMPWWSRLGEFKPVPERITYAAH